MFINFVIDADNTDDIVKAIELLSYHLGNKSLEPKKENWANEEIKKFENLNELISSVPEKAKHIIKSANILFGDLEVPNNLSNQAYKYITEELGKWKKKNSDQVQPKDG
jgi:hypothetical protein